MGDCLHEVRKLSTVNRQSPRHLNLSLSISTLF